MDKRGVTSMGKHAYLIMAHNEFDILRELLVALDDERNDIYIHIDKKTGDFPENYLRKSIRKSRIIFINRINVNWGGYSQIACELELIKEAKIRNRYDYYHMLTGVFYPLKSQDEIHRFFDLHQGTEFVGFDNSKDYSWRVKYIHLFNEMGKAVSVHQKLLQHVRNKFLGLQRRLHIERKSAKNIIFKKGIVYWSITDVAACSVLEKAREIADVYKWSFCADEMFVQTILFNSDLIKNVYLTNDDFAGSLRIAKKPRSWNSNSTLNIQKGNIENSISLDDIDWLMKSNAFFAMKFCGDTGLEAIKKIKERILA